MGVAVEDGKTADQTVDDLLKDKGKTDEGGAPDSKKEPEGEKLYAGKYKTVEELENAYKNSNSEASKLAQENADLKKATPSDDKDAKDREVSLEDLQASYKEDPVKTVLWMLKNIGREQTTEIVKDHLSARDTEADEQSTRAELKRDYPDLGNKESKLYQAAAEEYALFPKFAKADPAGALRNAVDRAVTRLGVSKVQTDEAQRRLDVDNHQVEGSRGRGEGNKLALSDEEKVIAKNLGIGEDEYLKGLETQGGRRVRVTRRGA